MTIFEIGQNVLVKGTITEITTKKEGTFYKIKIEDNNCFDPTVPERVLILGEVECKK